MSALRTVPGFRGINMFGGDSLLLSMNCDIYHALSLHPMPRYCWKQKLETVRSLG